jgi:hypothetical protein
MNRCKKCVLPDTHPGAGMDQHGVCRFCREAERKPWSQRLEGKEEQLAEILRSARGGAGGYDCMVPFSGGKDSSYVLYLATVKYGLRALAVNFNNGLQTPGALRNIRDLPRRLGVPLVTLAPAWPLMRRLYSRFLEEAGEFCSACNAMGYLTIATFCLREWQRLGYAPLTLGGWSSRYEAEPDVYSFDIAYFVEVVGADLVSEVVGSPLVDGDCLEVLKGLSDPRTVNLDGPGPIRYLMLPDYLPWDPARIFRELVERAGWQAPAAAGEDAHFDCLGTPVSLYLERRKYGFSQKTVSLSARVRDGLLSREDALACVESSQVVEPPEMERFLQMLQLDRQGINFNGKWHPERQRLQERA